MRTTLGILACGLYAWRVYDPKGSYAVFYDVSNWLTGWLLTGDGLAGLLRNLVNLVLLDQAEGFLLGIVFLSLLQVPIWAARKGARTARWPTACCTARWTCRVLFARLRARCCRACPWTRR